MIWLQSTRARNTRKRIVEYLAMLETMNRNVAIPYAEVRPMRSYPTPYGCRPRAATDCSESSALILEASGAPTPFVSAGKQCYTGTFLAKLQRVNKLLSRRGDVVVFVNPARPTGDHMVILLQGGIFTRDPLCWSHGRPGIDVMPISQMAAGFPGAKLHYLRTVPTHY